jgi:hypothetical protein
MARIVVGSPNLTQPLLLYPGLGPAMLEQHRRSSSPKKNAYAKMFLGVTCSITYLIRVLSSTCTVSQSVVGFSV